MKKIIIGAAIVCAAIVSQAATFNWSSQNVKLFGVNSALDKGNGTWDAGTAKADRGDQSCAFSYLLSIYDGDTLKGTATGDVAYGSLGKIGTSGIVINGLDDGKLYNYVLTISGTQTTLTNKKSDAWDYSDATVTGQVVGQVTTATMGATSLPETVPTTWTVAGAVAAPEPTSGLLLLLGMAGLALRRRRA